MRGKLSLSLIILLVLSSVVATGFYCTKKSAEEKAIPLDQPVSLMRNIDARATYTVGDVRITTNNSGDIIVLANTKDSASRKMFLLTGNTGKVVLNKSFKHAEVLYLLHSIIINSLDSKERYYLAVSKSEEQEIYGKLPASYKSFFSASLNGYSIVQMTGTLPTDVNIFKGATNPYNVLYKYRVSIKPLVMGAGITPDELAPPPPPTCQAGGVHSTGCSIGTNGFTCSVSCATGYYSCCNSPGGFVDCQCYKL